MPTLNYTQMNARILVVDDDTPARQLVRKYLASRGATVFEAENAYFALGRMTEAEIDLVITDVNMPGRSGLWLIEEIRTRWPSMPIIVTTTEEGAHRAIAEGTKGIAFCPKPYSLQDLSRVIEELIVPEPEEETVVDAPDRQHRLSGPYASPSLHNVIPGADAEQDKQIPWVRRVHPDDLERVLAHVEQCLDTGDPFIAEYRLFSHRGDIYWVLHEARVANFPNRQRVLAHEAVIDITRQRGEAESLRASEERHRFLTEYSSDMISVASWEGRYLYVSPASAALLGYEPNELIGSTFYDLVHELDRQAVRRVHLLVLEKMGAAMIAYRVKRKDNRYIWFESTIREVPRSGRDTPRELVVVSRDITERKLQEERLKDMAILDELTGLYNRRGFMALANQHLKQARRAKRQALLVFADLNGLKIINDTHGHADGDKALITAAEVFNRTFRDSDVVARVGGDEFAILAIEADSESVEAIKARLQSALDTVNRATGRPYQISVSVGIVSYDPEADTSVEEMMAFADREMYSDKRASRVASRLN
jgi:diguanylate cyclase (GGDEF)-like protein/PAS domain S-box-containing protein